MASRGVLAGAGSAAGALARAAGWLAGAGSELAVSGAAITGVATGSLHSLGARDGVSALPPSLAGGPDGAGSLGGLSAGGVLGGALSGGVGGALGGVGEV